jgi:type VI secretion system protein VasG
MTVNFMGLFGPNGPLPLHLTEYARDRQRNARDDTFVRFCDVFHHRMISLFYRAWAVNQPAVSFDRSRTTPDSDRFGIYLASTIGLGDKSLRRRDAVPDIAKQHFAGRLVQQTKPPEGLAAIVSDYFGVPVPVEEFVGQWIDIPASDQLRMGRPRDRQARADRRRRLAHLGLHPEVPPPSSARSRSASTSAAPPDASFARLVGWVRNYVGYEFNWDAKLVLRKTRSPPARLGGAPGGPGPAGLDDLAHEDQALRGPRRRPRAHRPRRGRSGVVWTRETAPLFGVGGYQGVQRRRPGRGPGRPPPGGRAMAEISLKSLFGKLNSLCYKASEAATVFCKMRGNPHVEVLHFFHQVLQLQDSDLHKIIRHYQLNPSDARVGSDRVARQAAPRRVEPVSDSRASSRRRSSGPGPTRRLLLQRVLDPDGHIVVGMLKTKGLQRELMAISGEFEKVKVEDLTDNWEKILGESVEAGLAAKDGSSRRRSVPGEASGAMSPAQMGKEEALKRFCKDLTEEARTGKIDPIVGRDEETRQVIDILMRRRQNNPVLVGEAGVGKTAVAEGFAHKIVENDVPPPLQGVRLPRARRQRPPGRREHEGRVRAAPQAGHRGGPGRHDAHDPVHRRGPPPHRRRRAGRARATRPSCSSPPSPAGLLRTVAATTWAEYKKHIEKDPALTRRFQTVQVDEPDEDRRS